MADSNMAAKFDLGKTRDDIAAVASKICALQKCCLSTHYQPKPKVASPAEPEIGSTEAEITEPEVDSVVWSCNEWDPLEEVIVGSVDGAVVPKFSKEIKATCPDKQWDFFRAHGGQPFPTDLVQKCRQEVEELCKVLKAEGVIVKRPAPVDYSKEYTTPHFSSQGFYAGNPRDSLMIVGDEIIESPMTWRCRYYEYLAWRPLVREYFRRGARWTQAPKSTLHDDLFTKNYNVESLEDRYRLSNDETYLTTEFEPTFDAADFIRAGRDIFAQRSQVTNLSGIEWVRRHLEPRGIRVHQLRFRDSSAMHIDATFNIIGPGLAIENPARPCEDRDWLIKKGWRLVPAATPTLPDDHPMFVATKWLCMNVLMLDPERVIVEEQEIPMQKLFRKLGLEVITVPFRHAYSFGGGIHCWTADVRRRGKMESYM